MAIDTTALMRKARGSGEGEAFQTAVRSPGFRLGAGARASGDFFVEVLIDLFPDGKVDLDRMESALAQLRWLTARGYRLGCRDGHVVCGEIVIPEPRLEAEVVEVQRGTARS